MLEDHVKAVACVTTNGLGESLADQGFVAADDVDHAGCQVAGLRVAPGSALIELEADAARNPGIDAENALAGAPIADRPCSRGVVADAAADVGLAGGRGVGGEEEAGGEELLVQLVDGDARLDAAAAVGGVYIEDRAAPWGEVDDDGAVGALAGEAGAAAAGEDGEVVGGAELDGADGVFDGGGDDDAEGLDLVEGGVRGVEHPVVEVESDFAFDGLGEFARECGALRTCFPLWFL